MIIKIKHSTIYTYSKIVPRLIQCIKLYPSTCANQEILNWKINSNSGNIVESHTDALGHRILNIFNSNFSGKLKITSEGSVRTKDFSGIIKGLKEKVNPSCFLRQTKLTMPCKKIEQIGRKAKVKGTDLVEFTHKLNLLVSESIIYVGGSTTTSTSSKEALEQGKGVCQDFAHILISVARLNNLPARYINGFLLDDLNSVENSTHAWVEIFIEGLGWVAFDPSHQRCIDEKYIRISVGYDFLDASIIKGVKTNYDGNEILESKVSINNGQ